METGTDLYLHESEALVGYSTVPNYRPGSNVPPYELELAYRRSLAGRNVPYANAFRFNLGVFF